MEKAACFRMVTVSSVNDMGKATLIRMITA